jgi:hypothetical protein
MNFQEDPSNGAKIQPKSLLLFKKSVCNSRPIATKGKAIPLQLWTGPEGSKRLRLPDFKTIGT